MSEYPDHERCRFCPILSIFHCLADESGSRRQRLRRRRQYFCQLHFDCRVIARDDMYSIDE